MGLWGLLKGGELVERIEWVDPPRDILVQRFAKTQVRVKVGGRLVVHADQIAALCTRGQVAGVYPTGDYTLDLGTLPDSFGLRGGSRPSFPADVYFVSTALRSDVAWATQAPVNVRLAGTAGPVRVQASGSFALAVTDPTAFLRDLLATSHELQEYRVTHLHNVIVTLFADVLRTANAPAQDLLGDRGWLGRTAGESIAAELRKTGVTLVQFRVKTVNLRPEDQEKLGLSPVESFDAEIGYRAAVPEPVIPRPEPRRPQPGPESRGAVEFVLSPLPQESGPASGRIPLSDEVPTEIFSSVRPPSPSPASGRYLFPDAGSIPNHVPQPPPIPPYLTFFVAIDGAPAGPFDLLTVAAKVREGTVAKSTLVWKPGMQSWAAAATVPELEPLFSIVPPPLPM